MLSLSEAHYTSHESTENCGHVLKLPRKCIKKKESEKIVFVQNTKWQVRIQGLAHLGEKEGETRKEQNQYFKIKK